MKPKITSLEWKARDQRLQKAVAVADETVSSSATPVPVDPMALVLSEEPLLRAKGRDFRDAFDGRLEYHPTPRRFLLFYNTRYDSGRVDGSLHPRTRFSLAHELGHYFAARRYAIDTTPPMFIPMPPLAAPLGSPIGSFGAFIRVRSPVLDRRQLLDVGAAGPIAGFVVAVAALIWGYLASERVSFGPDETESYVVFAGNILWLGDSLLTHWLREWLVPGDTAVRLSLPAFAGWVGCFLTGLNLLPLSQLDGGHIAYGLVGRRQTAVAMAAVGGLLYLTQYSWSWFLWVVLAFVIGGGQLGHPPVAIPGRKIPRSRVWVGVFCLAVFVATFVPVPFAR